jgi:hypothetical protein
LIISKRYDLKKKQRVASSFLFRSSFFATLPEMIKENSVIQKFYMTYYAKRK